MAISSGNITDELIQRYIGPLLNEKLSVGEDFRYHIRNCIMQNTSKKLGGYFQNGGLGAVVCLFSHEPWRDYISIPFSTPSRETSTIFITEESKVMKEDLDVKQGMQDDP